MGEQRDSDRNSHPAFGDDSPRVFLRLQEILHALQIKDSVEMVYHSCSEQGTETYSAGTLKFSDEDPVCRDVGSIEETP